MKKINNIRQLRAKKKQIKEQQASLEHHIQENWKDLKAGLKPAQIAMDSFNSLGNKRGEQVNGKHILKTTLNYGVSLLAMQLVNKAGEKLGRLFKK